MNIISLQWHCILVFFVGGYEKFSECYPDLCIVSQANVDDKACLGLQNLTIGNSSQSNEVLELGECDSGFSKDSDTQRDSWHGVELFQILPHLYLGNAETAQDLKTLQDRNIRFILNVTPNLPNAFEMEKDLGFTYMQIPIHDCLGENLAAYFDDAIEFIGNLLHIYLCIPCIAWFSVIDLLLICRESSS